MNRAPGAVSGTPDGAPGMGRPVVVVGAGPCGIAAGIALQRAGLPAVLFDRSCVVSAITGYPINMTFFSTPEKLAIGGVPFLIARDKPRRADALAYYRGVVRHFGLDVRQYEGVTRIDRGSAGFVAHSETTAGVAHRTAASAVVIATGYFGSPNRLDVPGEALPHVTHDFGEGHYAFDQEVVVVGGGNSAAEAALELYRAGGRVSLVHMYPELDKGIKPWVLPDLTNRIAEGSIRAHYGTRVARITPEHVVLTTADGELAVAARHVYLMIGYRPESTLLRQLGVPIDVATGIPAHDPATMETSVAGVFIAGVLASGYDANKIFIENGRDHGDLIARRLTAAPDRGPAADRRSASGPAAAGPNSRHDAAPERAAAHEPRVDG
ncbi:MAG TPA: YpdA family putative bacillithiol disulfide reductase [Gemmatimonadaceae bacterium]|nr:YpdA family putative bacillithiol disulfide reductase [Gemmatimonadaceae bacterium]